MLNVSQAIKDKFQSDVCRKELKITIGNTVLTNSAIYKDGFKLTEAVMDGAVEFVGCIASMLEFKISTLALAKGNYKGATVTAEVAVYLNANTLSSYIPLFHGFVDECTKSADGYYQQFVCYDRLAYLSDEPGYNMYKAAFNGSSIDLETFRDAIVLDCGMDAVNSQTLPNDDIVFRKRKRNKDITAMALLRHIAQINGAFGILNRDNRFEFRQIDDAASPESVLYYRDLKYSDYVVKPVGDSTTTPPTGSITIRTNSQDAGVTVDWTDYLQYAGTDPGWSDESQDTYLVDDTDANVVIDSYIIESNLISYKLKAAKKKVIGANILASLGHDAVFREHSVKCNGLPYVECCDKVLFTKADSSQIEFVVTKRVLEGVQNMTDTYSCTISSQDSNNKTFVSNVDKNTNGLSGSPDDALGLTEKTITANGTYAANDDGAEGYSQVTVDVAAQGPTATDIVSAIAIESLTAGDCVYVVSAGSTAYEIQSTIMNYNIQDGVVSDGDYIYAWNTSDSQIMRVPIADLTSTPEVYKSNVSNWYFWGIRSFMRYFQSGNAYMENVLYSTLISSNSNDTGMYASKEYCYLYDWVDLSTLQALNTHPSYGGVEKVRMISPSVWYENKYDNQISSSKYIIYVNGSIDTEVVLNERIHESFYNIIGDYFVGYSHSSGTLGYYDLNTDDGVWHPITDAGGNYFVSTDPTPIQYNVEGDFIWCSLGDNGLVILDSSLNVLYYPDIKNAGTHSNMFGQYFMKARRTSSAANVLYYIPRQSTMGKTNNKNHTGLLGWVNQNVAQLGVGTAYILFS